MTGAKFVEPDFCPNKCAQGSVSDEMVFFQRQFWSCNGFSRFQRDATDRTGTSNIHFELKIGAAGCVTPMAKLRVNNRSPQCGNDSPRCPRASNGVGYTGARTVAGSRRMGERLLEGGPQEDSREYAWRETGLPPGVRAAVSGPPAAWLMAGGVRVWRSAVRLEGPGAKSSRHLPPELPLHMACTNPLPRQGFKRITPLLHSEWPPTCVGCTGPSVSRARSSPTHAPHACKHLGAELGPPTTTPADHTSLTGPQEPSQHSGAR